MYEVRRIVKGFEREKDSESIHEIVGFPKISLEENGFEPSMDSVEESVSDVDDAFINPTIL